MRSVCSPHIIIFFIMAFIQATMLYGLAFFLPSIVYQLGFSANVTQLLSAGPSAAGCLGEICSKWDISPGLFTAYSSTALPVTLIAAFLSDRYESRGITAAIVSMLSVVGFALFLGNVLCLNEDSFLELTCWLGAGENTFLSYGALYLIVPGASGTLPIFAAWLANNSEPHYRRATNIALILIFNSTVCFSVISTVSSVLIPYHFRVEFWVPGVTHPKRDLNSPKQ